MLFRTKKKTSSTLNSRVHSRRHFSKQKNKPIKRTLPSQKERNKSVVLFWVLYSFLVLVFIGITVYTLFFSHFMEIHSVDIDGIDKADPESVVDEIHSYLNEKKLLFLPQNNLLIFSSSDLVARLQKKFIKIQNIQVQKSFPDSIQVSIIERKALLVVCSAGPCYIVNEEGVAYRGFQKEEDKISKDDLVKVIDENADPISIGDEIISAKDVEFMTELLFALKELGIEASSEYSLPSRVAQEVSVTTQEGWELHLSTESPLNQSMSSLAAFLSQTLEGEQRSRLEYVDLRVNNKIFYALKKEEGENAEENSAELEEPLSEMEEGSQS